jgi:hypothetical protein
MDHQPGPAIAGKVTTDRRPADKAASARDDEHAPEPAAVTWTRAQLRARIQQSGVTLASISEITDRQTLETERSPLADREAEP